MRYWYTPEGVVFTNVQTGDGRLIADDALYLEDQPAGWPLRVDWEDDGGHSGAVPVGAATEWPQEGEAAHRPDGWVDDQSPDGIEVIRRLDQDPPYPLGVSLDMDGVTFEVLAKPSEDEEPVVLLAASFPSANLRVDPDGRQELRVEGARAALTAAGLHAVVAAAGDGVPEDMEVVFTEASDSMLARLTSARIRGLTLVDIPAFHRAAIALRPEGWEPGAGEVIETEADGVPALAASVTGTTDLPVADRDTEWDGSAARTRVFELCTSEAGEVDEACVARGFLWRDDDANAQTQGAYSLGFADVIDDRLRIVPAGVFATAGGRGVDALEGVTEEERDRIKSRICSLYERVADALEDDEIECPFNDDDMAAEGEDAGEAETASAAGGCGGNCGCGGGCGGKKLAAVAASVARTEAPMRPPKDWFADPGFTDSDVTTVEDPMTGKTLRGVPMRYEDGRAWGHIAMWGQCHAGSPQGECVLTPHSTSGYAWFHHGYVETAEGDRLPVGSLTLGGGHADITLSYRAALDHYDDVSTLHAQVRAGEDAYGVWIAGAVMPDVWDDELAVRKLRGSSPSGDWRWVNGSLELGIAHCVNGPGFPVPRAQVASSGEVLSLVAAGAREVALLAEADDRATVELAATLALDTEGLESVMATAVEAGIDRYLARQQLATQAEQARASLRARGRDRAVERLRS